MEKQSKPAPDALLRALRGARASILLASLRRPRAPPPPSAHRNPSSSAPAAAAVTPPVARLSPTAAEFALARTTPRFACVLTAACLSRRVQDCGALRSDGILRGEVAAARREAATHARIAGSELLLVLAVAPVVLLLFLLLGLLAEAP